MVWNRTRHSGHNGWLCSNIYLNHSNYYAGLHYFSHFKILTNENYSDKWKTSIHILYEIRGRKSASFYVTIISLLHLRLHLICGAEGFISVYSFTVIRRDILTGTDKLLAALLSFQ